MDQLLATCECQVMNLCSSIDHLANESYGMLTASPLLFFIDAAWIAYDMMEQHHGGEFSEARAWLTNISNQLAKRGYVPYRELGVQGTRGSTEAKTASPRQATRMNG